MDYPKPDYKRGVLVYADGRTTAVDTVNGAEWWVQKNTFERSIPERFFKLADIAYNVEIGKSKAGIWVYTERPESEYRARPTYFRDPDDEVGERRLLKRIGLLSGGSPSGSDDNG